MNREKNPGWRKLSLLILAMMAALFLVTTANMPPFVTKLLEVGLVLAGYTLIGAWVYANADALEEEARRAEVQVRQPWHPHWWRPGLNKQQRHYLRIKYGQIKRLP